MSNQPEAHVADERRTHELKTDPAVFDAVARGDKTHEIRLNDRNFQVGDNLLLRETVDTGWAMRNAGAPLVYTGRAATRTISHIQTGYGLADDWCILSFRDASTQGADANDVCQLPPDGWYCTRGAGHDGPCAAHQHEPDRELDADDQACIARGMARLAAGAPAETPKPVGEAGVMPGTSGFTMACFKDVDVPLGTKLYVAQPAPATEAQGQAEATDAKQFHYFGLSTEELQWLLDGSLKPEEIASIDEGEQHSRVSELVHWFARFTQGKANSKWANRHACELAYFIATNSINRSIDLDAITKAAFKEGVNITPEERNVLVRIGFAAPANSEKPL